MAYIKYKNSDTLLPVVVRVTDNHVIRITTDAEPNLSGFRLYLRDNTDYPLDNGEYEGYTTLYRRGDGWYELSDDGSVYTEVAPVQPAEPTDEELTDEERAALEQQNQIAAISAQINAIKEQIRATDYQIIKAYEYSLVGKETEYDIAALHTERQAQRDQINELEEQLAELLV